MKMYRSLFVRYTDVYDIVVKGVGFNVRRISHFEARTISASD
jgi:hypothetical protein